jgi:tetratricopeptide (TPR) repeat protein
MTDHSQSRVVQYYCPSGLSPTDHVSVSGLDLSRDRQELLVSFESDQIYTFPVSPKSSQALSVAGQVEKLLNDPVSTAERGIDSLSSSSTSSSTTDRGRTGRRPLRELAAYGAHLNRYTFLKNAKYAGPRDEYICTGSDSGHAWVYEKSTGAVVGFWKADNSTCNGVIPHPSLPVFITYGIDSTAKLWRSTPPVDLEVDDSAIGRRQHSRAQAYEMSPTVRNWGEVKTVLDNLDLRDGGIEQTEIFPDHIPTTKILMRRGRLARTWLRESSSNSNRGVPKIGNDLHNLQQILKENLYTCLRSLYDDDDVPVESDIDDLKHRISLIRLRHQADRLGLRWNPSIPWAMESQQTVTAEDQKIKDSPEDHNVEPSDLVPDFPSDWMPNDPDMSSDPFDFSDFFNRKEYGEFFRDHYCPLDERNAIDMQCADEVKCNSEMNGDRDMEEEEDTQVDNNDNFMEEESGPIGDAIDEDVHSDGNDTLQEDTEVQEAKMSSGGQESEDESEGATSIARTAKSILLETMKTLKDGGNAALKNGNLDVAAHRYDKAIQYAAMFFMKDRKMPGNDWNPLLKTLILTRLNMALMMLKPHFNELQVAANQARLALQELEPFCDVDNPTDICPETKDEILNLKAKAHFRLGSAQYDMGDFSSATKSFEESIKATNAISDPKIKPDQLVLRRLAEAKREHVKRNKRQRKKFKLAFASTTSPLAASPSSPTSSSSSIEISGARPAEVTPVGAAVSSGRTNGDTASTTSTAVISNRKAPPPGGSTTGSSSHDSEVNPLNSP